MAKKSKTQNQIEYQKQITRIKRAIKRSEKQGYVLYDSIIPDKPKRITKNTLEELKRITPSKIRYESMLLDYETGEVVKEEKVSAPRRRVIKNNTDKENVSRETFEQPTPDKIAPTNYDILDRITDLIEEIPMVIPSYDRYNKKWNAEWNWQSEISLMSIFINTMQSNDIDEVRSYYESVMEDLAELLTIWKKTSEQEVIEQGFTQAQRLLNMGNAFTSIESQALGNAEF